VAAAQFGLAKESEGRWAVIWLTSKPLPTGVSRKMFGTFVLMLTGRSPCLAHQQVSLGREPKAVALKRVFLGFQFYVSRFQGWSPRTCFCCHDQSAGHPPELCTKTAGKTGSTSIRRKAYTKIATVAAGYSSLFVSNASRRSF